MVNSPILVTPMKQRFLFSGSGVALPRSSPEDRSALISETIVPFRVLVGSDPSSKPTIETWTAAPSSSQSRSLHAQKMLADSLILSNTALLAPPRIDWVANRPTLPASPASTSERAFSNQ